MVARRSKPDVVPPPAGQGPPPYVRGASRDELRAGGPDVTVVFTQRAFLWLWRSAESQELRMRSSGAVKSLPEALETAQEAVASFRAAAAPEEPPPPPKRRVVKKRP